MWNWIKKLFKKSKPANNPIPPKKEEGDVINFPKPVDHSGKSKIAILIGHGASDPGATCWNGMAEHDYNKKVAAILEARLSNVTLYFKSSVGGWAPTYAKLAVTRPDLSVELHLNAYNGKAKGCEVLITSESSRSIGEMYAAEFCLKFQRVMRGAKGIKWLGSGDRGFGNVYSANKCAKKAILLESFFCDNKDEWIEPTDYAEFLISFLKKV
jgi:N-acetylmuramoyl-L-alanine amidase